MHEDETGNLPTNIAAPARRALAAQNIQQLEDLTQWTEEDLAALHGIGPNALAKLRDALAARGLAFAPAGPRAER